MCWGNSSRRARYSSLGAPAPSRSWRDGANAVHLSAETPDVLAIFTRRCGDRPRFAHRRCRVREVRVRAEHRVADSPVAGLRVGPDRGMFSATLAAPLVVEALDLDNHPVSGVQITWAVAGGVPCPRPPARPTQLASTSVTWTLAPTPGVQAVTATSTAITGASVGFTASNGATITGTVVSTTTPQGMLTASTARRVSHATAQASAVNVTHPTRSVRDLIVVGFRGDRLHVAAAGSGAYHSMDAARATTTVMAARSMAIMRRLPITDAELSPAILAARFRVLDTTKVDSVITALSADSMVAWVTREHTASIWRATRLASPRQPRYDRQSAAAARA